MLFVKFLFLFFTFFEVTFDYSTLNFADIPDSPWIFMYWSRDTREFSHERLYQTASSAVVSILRCGCVIPAMILVLFIPIALTTFPLFRILSRAIVIAAFCWFFIL